MGSRHMLFGLLLLIAASAFDTISKPGCPDRCGNVSIPYPFGINEDCSRSEEFELACNDTHYRPPKPFWEDVYEIKKITLEGQANVLAYAASDCYNKSGSTEGYNSRMRLSKDGPFTFSDTHNKFTAIGCDTVAYITGFLGRNFTSGNFSSGCVSRCWEKESVIDGNCTGIGCCQTSIPQGATWFYIELTSLNNHASILDFNPCSFAFLLADDDQFKFNINDLSNGSQYNRNDKQLPVALDWAIGNETCERAKKKLTSYACKGRSACYNSTNGPGYRCNCSKGYKGNPYLEGGCIDIDECKVGNYTCSILRKCKNTDGSYSCTLDIKQLVGVLGTCSSLLFVIIGAGFIYCKLKKRKNILLKQRFFKENGGLLLQQQITSHRVAVTTKIFSAEELQRATNYFSEDRIIGRGGNGTVYKGILSDNTIVAIKKSQRVNETQKEQFINEVFIVSQINHRNVVRLLGCCLENEVPLLVYEFISNGTLFHHIHDEACLSSLSLGDRLRIASETAGALDYLHSAASIPIFHRDVKSTNILLESNLTAKVSDFGASRLVPLDQTQITTLVQGTLGYLDPEYLQTGQLTEKSDVYSFGVVLVELLTGEKPICMNRSEEERSLSMYFISSMKENHLFEILENRVKDEGLDEQLLAVAQLAKRCLEVKGEERPTMKEVARELEGLRRSVEHTWVQVNNEETVSLHGEQGTPSHGNGNAAEQESLNNFSIASMGIGR